MILIDANLLLYAKNEHSEFHQASRQWLRETISSGRPVAFAWVTILAFLRLGTSLRVFPNPLQPFEAAKVVSDWFEQPNVRIAEPGDAHWKILAELITKGQVRAALMTDAHLAALAIEHGYVLCTTDRGFARFPGLQFRNPIAT